MPSTTAKNVPDKIRFAALVQFTEGTVDRIDLRNNHQTLKFQDAVYEDEHLSIETNAYVKLVTRERCIGVVYGPGDVFAAKAEKPWRIQASTVRWMCPEGTTSQLALELPSGTLNIETNGAEFFVTENRLLILRGSPKVNTLTQPLKPMALYALDKKPIQSVQPAATPWDIYQFNNRQPAPKESLVLNKPDRPKTVANTRVMLGPIGGGGGLTHDQGDFNQDDLSSNGGRLTVQMRHGKRSWIIALNIARELSADEEKKNNQQPNTPNNSYPAPGKSASRVKMPGLEFGLRFQHERWWSPYLRAGVAQFSNELSARSMSNQYSQTHHEYIGVTGAGGLEAIYSPGWLPWLGIYGFGEFALGRTLVHTKSENHSVCTGCSFQPSPPSGGEKNFTTHFLQLGAGLFTQF